jgi:hypothetical protein
MKGSSIVLEDQYLKTRPYDDRLMDTLWSLIVPEIGNGLPGAERGFGVAVHGPLMTTNIEGGTIGTLSIAFYHWLATSELLKYVSNRQWHHPLICPKRYPRGLTKPATALGNLWKVVWETLHYWSNSDDTLLVFERLTREVGGLLLPYAWKDDEITLVPCAIQYGDISIYRPWDVARTDKKKQDTCSKFINRAAIQLRRGENPYVDTSQSYALIKHLLDLDSEQGQNQLKAIAQALADVAKAWDGTTAVHRDLRFKGSKGKAEAIGLWMNSRSKLWELWKLSRIEGLEVLKNHTQK